ncbi:MAG TPA: hypothetical protein VK624_17175 [Steroidobacteraceae bacterium]|nr:hypothetical protein [Steroidobacteraceae bacterium]
MSLPVVSLEVDSAALLMRRWGEARVKFDQTRVDFGRVDCLAKLTARMHRDHCRQRLARPGCTERRTA